VCGVADEQAAAEPPGMQVLLDASDGRDAGGVACPALQTPWNGSKAFVWRASGMGKAAAAVFSRPEEGAPMMRIVFVAIGVWVGLCGTAMAQADDAILGQIMIFAGNFCPVRWLPTDGRTLQINGYTALFSILGTIYGGDGQTTFALPNSQPILTKSGAPLTQCIAVVGVYPRRD